VFGLALLIPGLWIGRDHARIVRTWRPVDVEGVGGEAVSFRSKGRVYYRACYTVCLKADGQEYHLPLSSAVSHSSRQAAQEEADRYREGARHRVWRHPETPYDIRENVGWNARFFVLPLIFSTVGFLMLVISGVLLRWAWRQPPGPRCPACSTAVAPYMRFCPQCSTRRAETTPENPEETGWEPHERRAAERERAQREAAAERRNRTGNRIIGMVGSLVGLTMLTAGAVVAWKQYREVPSWPTAEAVVTRSDLEIGHDREGRIRVRPRIEMRFSAGGREVQAQAATAHTNRYAHARRMVDANPVGSRPTVRYNPSQVREVHLGTAPAAELLALPLALGLLGLMFSVLGLVLLYQGFFRRARFCAQCARALAKQYQYCPFCGMPVAAMTS
jgi:hypothetical protein